MSVIIGFCIILGFWGAGEVVSYFIGHVIPGSVIGMLLLFAALSLKLISAGRVRSVAEFLAKNMTIFFLPASMGIMDQWGLISVNLWGWLIVVFLSTIAVLISSGYMAKWMMKLAKKGE